MFAAHKGGGEARRFALRRLPAQTGDGLFGNFELSGAYWNLFSQFPSVHRLDVLAVLKTRATLLGICNFCDPLVSPNNVGALV